MFFALFLCLLPSFTALECYNFDDQGDPFAPSRNETPTTNCSLGDVCYYEDYMGQLIRRCAPRNECPSADLSICVEDVCCCETDLCNWKQPTGNSTEPDKTNETTVSLLEEIEMAEEEGCGNNATSLGVITNNGSAEEAPMNELDEEKWKPEEDTHYDNVYRPLKPLPVTDEFLV